MCQKSHRCHLHTAIKCKTQFLHNTVSGQAKLMLIRAINRQNKHESSNDTDVYKQDVEKQNKYLTTKKNHHKKAL